MKYRLTLAYLVLLAVLVPWYWPEDVTVVYFGFPLWVLISLAVGFIVSSLTAYVLITHQSDNSGGDGEQ